MENLTLEKLQIIRRCLEHCDATLLWVHHDITQSQLEQLYSDVLDAIKDKEFEEKTRPLNF